MSGLPACDGEGLADASVIVTPGSGFGSKREGFFRIIAFNSRANAEELARRLQELKWWATAQLV